jgi:hypothetical protein
MESGTMSSLIEATERKAHARIMNRCNTLVCIPIPWFPKENAMGQYVWLVEKPDGDFQKAEVPPPRAWSESSPLQNSG